MEMDRWHPEMDDDFELPDGWREGDEPPELLAAVEPEVPDPNMEGMPTIFGYEDCDFDKKKKPRPPPSEEEAMEEPVPQEVKTVSVPSEEECREALREFVSQNFCLGKEPVETLVINSISPSNAFTYILESFAEKRKVGYDYKPYKGGEIDDPSKGRAPETWQMDVECKKLFKDDTIKVELPHTSTVRTCHHCTGYGFVPCELCQCWGRHTCRQCPDGDASMCSSCDGQGTIQCSRCEGRGKKLCPACDGYKAIRCFLELKVKFKTYKNESIKEETELPDYLIKEVKGETLFVQTEAKLAPISGFPISEIDSISKSLLRDHGRKVRYRRLLQQRHKVVAVPVAEVTVTWKNEPGKYWVYGKEHKVYCPSYPDTCACCVIL